MDPFVFDEIPYDWLEPGTFMEVRPNYANVGILPYPVHVCLIVHRLATGTLVDGEVREVVNPDDGITLCGAGSIGAQQIAAFRLANKTTPLSVISLEDADGATKAQGGFTFAGAVSNDIVLRFRVNDVQIRMTAKAGDEVAALATKLSDAINAATTDALVTANANAGVVTVTSRHGGEVGNQIDLRIDRYQPLPDGLTVAISPMSGGTGNPDVAEVFDAIPNEWFTQFQMPWSDATNLATFADELKSRFTAMAKRDAQGFVGHHGTFGQLGTVGELTNSAFLTVCGMKKCPTAPWAFAASACGIATFHLTNDPARQLRSLDLPGVNGPDKADTFTEVEQELLLRKGVSSFDTLPDGAVTISRMITTYKVSNLNIADRAWLDIMVPATTSRIRYDWQAYFSLLYPRAKLVEDEETAAFLTRPASDADGQESNAIVTPRRAHASWAARCALYADRVWIQEASRTIRESRFAISDDDPNRLEANQQIRIAGNMMVLAAALEFQV